MPQLSFQVTRLHPRKLCYVNIEEDSERIKRPKPSEIERLNNLKSLGVKFNEIGLLLENKGNEPSLWGRSLSSDNKVLSVATLSLIMPEFDWDTRVEDNAKNLWNDTIQRFHEDFYEVTPSEGGIIPISEITTWINSLRILILSGQEDKILTAAF